MAQHHSRKARVFMQLALLYILGFIGSEPAAGNDVVDGDTGVLYINGVVTHSTCNLDTDSVRQSISLGTIASGQLAAPGQRGAGKAFHLHLHDCFDSGAEEKTPRTGIEQIKDGQPFVRISFISATDAQNPALIAVRGAQGLGLRLEDDRHHLVPMNETGEPLRVAAGDPVLSYSLIPERTTQPLTEGAWQSIIYMRFSYE